MEHFSGNIEEGNQVLFENVEGELFVNAPPGRAKSWHGTFHLSSAKNIKRGRLYRLKSDDGRSGDIRITSIQIVLVLTCKLSSFEATDPSNN